MKLLRILNTEAATSFGGQEQYIYRMMMAMRDRGHYLEAVCQPQAQLTSRLREQGFIVHTMLMDGPLNFMEGVVKIRKILRKGRFDVLNTNSRRDTILAGSAGRCVGTPLIVRTRHLAKRVGSLFSYTVIPHRVTCASDYVRRHLIERGVRPDYVETVYPAVDPPALVAHSTLRRELELAKDAIVVGCVAVMRAQKGHRALIDAIEPLIAVYPDLHLVFVGGGSPVFEEIQAYVAVKQLGAHVHLLGARRDVPNLLAGFDLFALATEQEASGTVFLEAAAAGLAVIGTNVGGVPEMIQSGVTGLLVPLHDQDALTQALKKLIDEPDLRKRMGQAGQRRVRGERAFSSEAMAHRLESCYTRWLNERRS
ncbi:MAG: glycosyltransferase family 4 protein [Burkholderiaceae bacterium]